MVGKSDLRGQAEIGVKTFVVRKLERARGQLLPGSASLLPGGLLAVGGDWCQHPRCLTIPGSSPDYSRVLFLLSGGERLAR